MGLKRSDVFQSKYCSQADLEHPVIVTIKHAEMETIKSDDGNEDKAVLYFERDRLKPMILNSGNWATIEEAYGTDSDMWINKPIEVYVDPNVMFGKKKVGGVRVRIPSGTGSVSTPATTAPVASKASTPTTFGPAWADRLTGRIGELAAKEPLATMGCLRNYLKANVEGADPAVVDGSPMNWPRDWMESFKAWCDDIQTPF